MIGSGVLLECLADARVSQVVSVVRRPTGRTHQKLREVAHADFTDLSALAHEFRGADACYFCIGVTSVGMDEAAYRAVTYDVALAAARAMLDANPQMTFCFVSGAGADSSERGRVMWARVKGATENAILAMPFRNAFVFRPALVQPVKGVRSRTGWYRVFYAFMRPLAPLLLRFFPGSVTTTSHIGRAMLAVSLRGSSHRILHSAEINEMSR
jgi:uncharacterized protein YbjT (DUF2867 family)